MDPEQLTFPFMTPARVRINDVANNDTEKWPQGNVHFYPLKDTPGVLICLDVHRSIVLQRGDVIDIRIAGECFAGMNL